MAEPVELASSEDEESEEECEIGYEQLDIVSETVNDTTVDSDEKKQREGYVLLTQEEDSGQGETTTATSVEQERGDTPEESTTNANQPAPMADSELDCIVILHCRDRCFPSSCLLSEHVDAVKNAMAGFVLPSASVPGWAKDIPESVWKQELLQGLRTQTKLRPS